jgi:hypothetical protein
MSAKSARRLRRTGRSRNTARRKGRSAARDEDLALTLLGVRAALETIHGALGSASFMSLSLRRHAIVPLIEVLDELGEPADEFGGES